LTKTYEQVRRGRLADLAAWASDGVLGEITIVVAGANPVVADVPTAVTQVRALVAEGVRLKDACAQIAAATGCSKKVLYDAVVSRA